MQPASARAVRGRAALLWAVVSAGGVSLALATAPPAATLVRDLGHSSRSSFSDVLVQGCAVAALVATAALWLATTEVAVAVLRTPAPPTRRVGPLRAALLAACGVAALGAASPAHASPPDGPDPRPAAELLAGLPLPDRAEGGGPREPVATVRVRPGDSLWTVAARALGAGASEADIASYWRRLQALNAHTTGPDPDLVHPGQHLRLPPH